MKETTPVFSLKWIRRHLVRMGNTAHYSVSSIRVRLNSTVVKKQTNDFSYGIWMLSLMPVSSVVNPAELDLI